MGLQVPCLTLAVLFPNPASSGECVLLNLFRCRFEEFVRKEKKNINPDEEIMAESSELKLKQVLKCV